MTWPVVLLVAAALCLVGVGMYYAAKAARERREALAALAARRGWSFVPDDDPSISDLFSVFGAFQQGHSREGSNTMRGFLRIDGRQFDLQAGDFTYKVTSSNGKTTTTTTHTFSYVMVDCPYPNIPELLIRRETIMDKIGSAIGFADINFESAEFNRKFFVKGADRKFAFAVVHPRMIEFLMDGNPPPIEIQHGCACFGTNDTWSPEEYDEQLDFIAEFFGLWPQYLQDQLETRSLQ